MAEGIYGASIPHLKGRIARSKIQHVEPVKITSVPKKILDKYKDVTIFCDLIQINGICFLNTISRNIMFATGLLPVQDVHFSTRALIWVHFENMHYFSQLIFILFSYLKNARHNLVIELCSELRIFQKYILQLFI